MTILTLLGILIIVSLVITTVAYKIQQTQQHQRELKLSLTRRSTSLRDAISRLNRLGAPLPLVIEQANELIRVMQRLLALTPNDTRLQALFAGDLQQRELLKTGERGTEVDCTCTSPQELAEATICLQDAGHFLQTLLKQQRLSSTVAAELANQLRRLMLDVEVFSHLASADQNIETNERLMALNHLKHAREALRNTSLEFPEKSLFIQDITERIKAINQSSVIIEERHESLPAVDSDAKKTW